MAHLWIHTINEWSAFLLRGSRFVLDSRDASLARERVSSEPAHGAILLNQQDNDAQTWVLLCGPNARIHVNGETVRTGVRVLRDRDELLLEGASPVFFSTERQASVEPFPGAAQPGLCPRCREEISRGSLAVRCPTCDIWHHAAAERPCWSYAETCALCEHPTALEAGFRWTPETP